MLQLQFSFHLVVEPCLWCFQYCILLVAVKNLEFPRMWKSLGAFTEYRIPQREDGTATYIHQMCESMSKAVLSFFLNPLQCALCAFVMVCCYKTTPDYTAQRQRGFLEWIRFILYSVVLEEKNRVSMANLFFSIMNWMTS